MLSPRRTLLTRIPCMDTIDRLSSLFERFPGIGPRQAQRFVQFLLRNPSARRELAEAVGELGSSVQKCPECQRFHAGARALCNLCANHNRDQTILAIVASDADLSAMERSGTFAGRYFVLGGTISLASDKTKNLRMQELFSIIPIRVQNGLREIVLAFPANPEGDATVQYLREELKDTAHASDLHITALGRGLSTGSELEYADPDTLKSAFASRR